MTYPTLRSRMPKRLIAVLVFVFLQALGNGAFAVLTQIDISERERHYQDVLSEMHFAVALSYVFAGALLLGGFAVAFGHNWGRWLVMAFEALSAIVALIALFSGNVAMLVGLVLFGLAMSALFSEKASDWFADKALERRVTVAAPSPR